MKMNGKFVKILTKIFEKRGLTSRGERNKLRKLSPGNERQRILENDTENKNAEPLSVREAVQEKTVNSK